MSATLPSASPRIHQLGFHRGFITRRHLARRRIISAAFRVVQGEIEVRAGMHAGRFAGWRRVVDILGIV